ncbi:MAG TPA: carbonate dehydratase [Gemmatimonadales bacterium]|nr:carbonate dehydratase [Gemmatimonadales bacterium]
MRTLGDLFRNNQQWAARMTRDDPAYFDNLARQQAPRFLWIGCSDSRVPANEIVDLQPGELFVHRNVANVVVHTDLNCLTVLQFAIDVLKVEHVMVVGHYGCSGVGAALRGTRLGLIDNWLRHVQDVRDRHASELQQIADERARADRLCELNVLEQVVHVCQTSAVQDAWARGQHVEVHGWIYALQDGLLRDLGLLVGGADQLGPRYEAALRHEAWSLTTARGRGLA